MDLKFVFEPSADGGYTVCVSVRPGCISEGDTLEEARVSEEGVVEELSI